MNINFIATKENYGGDYGGWGILMLMLFAFWGMGLAFIGAILGLIFRNIKGNEKSKKNESYIK